MSSGFQLPGFQQSGFQTAQDDGAIVQTLPSLTQLVEIEVLPDLPSDVLGRAFLFRAPPLKIPVRAEIKQTLPALTQQAFVTVSDDELVLLLI